jgi:hypothetical protein
VQRRSTGKANPWQCVEGRMLWILNEDIELSKACCYGALFSFSFSLFFSFFFLSSLPFCPAFIIS